MNKRHGERFGQHGGVVGDFVPNDEDLRLVRDDVLPPPTGEVTVIANGEACRKRPAGHLSQAVLTRAGTRGVAAGRAGNAARFSRIATCRAGNHGVNHDPLTGRDARHPWAYLAHPPENLMPHHSGERRERLHCRASGVPQHREITAANATRYDVQLYPVGPRKRRSLDISKPEPAQTAREE